MHTVSSQKSSTEIVWVDTKNRVASFHPVDGWQEQCFQIRDYFLNYLYALQEQGYRFQ